VSLGDRVARWISRLRPGRRAIERIDSAPLLGGGAIHVVDLDGRRLVFAATANAVGLLARYPIPAPAHGEAGGRAEHV
jgi:hypothetical protein